MNKIILLFMFLIISCTTLKPPEFEIRQYSDKFSDVSSVYTKNNFASCHLSSSSAIWNDIIAFNYHKTTTKDTIIYSINISYNGVEWMFIERGKSLIVVADGEKMFFDGNGSIDSRTIVGAHDLYESAYYDTDKGTLRKIATAKNVEFQVNGKEYTFDCSLSEANKNNLLQFLNNN